MTFYDFLSDDYSFIVGFMNQRIFPRKFYVNVQGGPF